MTRRIYTNAEIAELETLRREVYAMCDDATSDQMRAAKAALRAVPAQRAAPSLREAAQATIRVWQEAPYGVSFGSIMELALNNLAAALENEK